MLELGIALHSVLIGVALGVSETPVAAKPLAAALVFHQSFEGFALGSAIAEAGHEGCAGRHTSSLNPQCVCQAMSNCVANAHWFTALTRLLHNEDAGSLADIINSKDQYWMAEQLLQLLLKRLAQIRNFSVV